MFLESFFKKRIRTSNIWPDILEPAFGYPVFGFRVAGQKAQSLFQWHLIQHYSLSRAGPSRQERDPQQDHRAYHFRRHAASRLPRFLQDLLHIRRGKGFFYCTVL